MTEDEAYRIYNVDYKEEVKYPPQKKLDWLNTIQLLWEFGITSNSFLLTEVYLRDKSF